MKTFLLSMALVTASVPAQACGGYGGTDNFFVHEWGTFTSIQGTDGVPIAWQSLIAGDLPDFVYNRTRFADAAEYGLISVLLGKGSLAAKQRIETPVLYFYSLEPRTVDVRVNLPFGTITEWYPQVSTFGPAPANAAGPFINPEKRAQSYVEWSQVQILPDQNAPLPAESKASHYYAARETDASHVRVTAKPSKNWPAATQTEKFLFYRGVGEFDSPLLAKAGTSHSVALENRLEAPLRHLFVIDQRAGKYAFSYHPSLAPGERKTVDTSNLSSRTRVIEGREDLIAAMRNSLTASGLFEKESAAMVKTWADSWFDEPGLRVLYVLPDKWVETTLPLKVSPAPTKTARVFVGRAELLTPEVEHTLARLVTSSMTASAEERRSLEQAARDLRLGRFTQAAFSRIMSMNEDKQFRTAASRLQADVLAPARASKPAASVIGSIPVAFAP